MSKRRQSTRNTTSCEKQRRGETVGDDWEEATLLIPGATKREARNKKRSSCLTCLIDLASSGVKADQCVDLPGTSTPYAGITVSNLSIRIVTSAVEPSALLSS